jgi:iron complex outermembrane recepter protein
MNLQTAIMNPDAYGELNTGVGSYGTRKANVQLGSGIMENGWQVEGRLSKIDSDGYIDRASSDLRSFYLSGARHGDRSLLKADLFSGQEVTYQAWNGVPEPILNNDSAQLEHYITQLWLGERTPHTGVKISATGNSMSLPTITR